MYITSDLAIWKNNDVFYLVEVENNVKLTNIRKEFIQKFNKQMNGLQVSQFVIVHIHSNCEEQTSISSVNKFVIHELGNYHTNIQSVVG